MPNRTMRMFLLLLSWLIAGTTCAEESRFAVKHDRERCVSLVTITPTDGKILWADVAQGLGAATELEAAMLSDLLPSGGFVLESKEAWAMLMSANLAFGGDVRFGRIPNPQRPGEKQLEITLDRRALLASERHWKSKLRAWGLGALQNAPGVVPRKFGLAWVKPVAELPPERPLVVLVHGFQSCSERTAGLCTALPAAGYATATFDYPGDQPIAESAQGLSNALRGLAKEFPRRKVTLIAFSMGGLVARATVEDPKLDPGNVSQLIQVATPNQGSQMATFGFAIKVWNQLADPAKKEVAARLFTAIEDGLCDASVDLLPDSAFLKELNARKRNPQVRYSLFVGTAAPLTPADLALLQKAWAETRAQNRFLRLLDPKSETLLADLDEVVNGRGDGAVAAKRAKLPGVDDTVVLECTHAEMLGEPGTPATRQLREEIFKRLH